MIDSKKPTVSARAEKGQVHFFVVDKEVSLGLQGNYAGVLSAGGKSFCASLQQKRADQNFSGWLVDQSSCLSVLPLNSEIWEIFGRLDFGKLTVSGTINRISAKKTFLGRISFNGTFDGSKLVLNLLPNKGTLSLVMNQADLVRPAFREG